MELHRISMELHRNSILHRVLWSSIELYGGIIWSSIELYGEILWSSICQFSIEKFLWNFPEGGGGACDDLLEMFLKQGEKKQSD
jgi:hypothetical protein